MYDVEIHKALRKALPNHVSFLTHNSSIVQKADIIGDGGGRGNNDNSNDPICTLEFQVSYIRILFSWVTSDKCVKL